MSSSFSPPPARTIAPPPGPQTARAPTESLARPRANWRRFLGLREAGVYYALILLVLSLSVATAATGRPNYLNPVNLTNILYQSSLVSIMGVAMTVILITGNFDLSVASVAALAAAVLISVAGVVGFWPGVAVALLVAAGVGALNGAIVQYVGINAFIVTLGTLTAIRGLVLIVTNGRSLSVDNPDVLAQMMGFESGRVAAQLPMLVLGAVLLIVAAVLVLRSRRSGRRIPSGAVGAALWGVALIAAGLLGGHRLTLMQPVIYMAAFTLAAWFVLSFTTIGRRIYAVGGNPEAARLSGINVNAYKMAGFVLSSLAAGFAGVLFASRLGAINPTALQGAELTVIASAILGGTSLLGGAGSVVKTVIGSLLLFTLNNGFNILNMGANYQGVIEGTVVVAAAAIYTVGGRRRQGR
jgi:D-xylose transport system permease protein